MIRRKRRRKVRLPVNLPGSAPGIVCPAENSVPPTVQVIAYNSEEFLEQPVKELSALPPLLDRYAVTWLDVDGLADAELITHIGEQFGFHKLALEDVATSLQRAKLETYGEHLFVVTRMIVQTSDQLDTEQFSMFLGSNYLVTFQEKPGDCLDPVRLRIRASRGRIRKSGPDHLFYALLDAVIDAYFPVLEKLGDRMDNLEEQIVAVAQPNTIALIHDVKRDLLQIRRAVWPLRDVLNSLLRDANPLITSETRLYLRDCYDHVVGIMDLVENYRELAADLMDLYLSMVSNRMNEVMKVLTIIATIFIPLTFIVGVYGMNFDIMPELRWRFGYAFVWILMLAVTLGEVIFFRRKGWIGQQALEPSKPGE